MTTATIGSALIVAYKPIMRLVFLYSRSTRIFFFLSSKYLYGFLCQVCAVCLYNPYCIQPSRQIPTSIHLSVALDLCFETERMISCAFSCRRKNPIPWISQAKIWAAQHNLISSVSYPSTPWYSHGNAFLLRESQSDQCGPFLIWTWKKGR